MSSKDEKWIRNYVNQMVVYANLSMRNYIDKIISQKLIQKLDDVKFQDIIEKDIVKKALKAASRFSHRNEDFPYHDPVDITDLDNNEEKLERILNEATWPCERYVKQILSLGDEIKDYLVSCLDRYETMKDHVIVLTIEGVLKEILDETDAKTILKLYREKGILVDLVRKYPLPGKEDAVFEKLNFMKGIAGWQVLFETIEMSLNIDEPRAITVLKEKATTADMIGNEALTRLAAIPEVDLADTLRKAAQNSRDRFHITTVIKIMLERGVHEGIDYAITFLKTADSGIEKHNKELANTVRRQTGARGNYQDMADYLSKNKRSLKWNIGNKQFELSI